MSFLIGPSLRRLAGLHTVKRYASTISAAEIVQPVKAKTRAPRRVARLLPSVTPTGKITAITSSEEYSTDALQRRLAALKLIGTGQPSNALNLLGEAVYLPRWTENGEMFIFENGSVVAWNMSEEDVHRFMTTVIQEGKVEINPLNRGAEQESLNYCLEEGGTPHVRGNTIFLQQQHVDHSAAEESSGPTSSALRFALLPLPGKLPSLEPAALPDTSNGLPMTEDDLLVRLAVSSALVRSTKLAVYESQLDAYIEK